ncbi:hypothetical protein FGO68_gene16909 [Halteria grandinella]|uniref:Uncharacterized protein n=1 Tax=Halteria grandinella TaxID=5974 RepID=A0A8J8P5X6_HALGN|nr:hypothetical protein FGO68_gene16909 [Halteria grandinella]
MPLSQSRLMKKRILFQNSVILTVDLNTNILKASQKIYFALFSFDNNLLKNWVNTISVSSQSEQTSKSEQSQESTAVLKKQISVRNDDDPSKQAITVTHKLRQLSLLLRER